MQWIDSYAPSFDGYAVREWLMAHTDIAIYITGLYLLFVFYSPPLINKYLYGGKEIQRGSVKPAWVRYPWAVWNLMLCVFSFYGSWHVVPAMARHFREDGLRNTLCTRHDDEFYTGPVGMAVGLFALSKGPEFIDTIFILLSGRSNLPFLQWFHHSTTFLYAWHAYSVGSSALNFAAALNYSVHAVMYFYFCLAELGFTKLVRPFAKYITLMQILQMVVGFMLTFTIIYNKYQDYIVGRPDSDPKACSGTPWDAARAQILIACANFILFSQMFLKAYVFKKPHADAKKPQADNKKTK